MGTSLGGTYSIRPLPALDGYLYSQPWSINNYAVVSGSSVGSGGSIATRWNVDRTPAAIGGFGSIGLGINDLGDIAGAASSASGSDSPTRWPAGSVQQAVLADPDVPGEATATNNRGEVAGHYWNSGLWVPFLSAAGTVTNLETPEWFDLGGEVYSINESGWVGGLVRSSTASYAAVWIDGSLQLLPYARPAAVEAQVLDVTDQGLIVGYDFVVGEGARPLVWKGGLAVTLGLTGQWKNGFAWGANNDGVIVGVLGSLHNAATSSAFLYRDGSLYDLQSLLDNGAGWDLSAARAINDQGDIVGWGEFRGVRQGFILTHTFGASASVPEPGTAPLIGTALVAFGMLLRRRSG